jgi:glycosyltransferase involved in cell wall biosynthesis
MKILFFTKYSECGPSSRYRVFKYIPFYESLGIKCGVSVLLSDWYFDPSNNFLKYIKILGSYFRRFFIIMSSWKYDIIYIEYELFPYLPSVVEKLFKFLKVKYIVEYDDAVFHNYNSSRKIDNVIKNATYVITGSPYLTDYVLRLNSNVIEIPTSLNLSSYSTITNNFHNDIFTIGWIGSKSTSVNVVNLVSVFWELKELIPYRINLIGFDKSLYHYFEGLNVNFIEWNSATEINEIMKFDVGIMPLEINQFNKGKCGFKLIQYMACGKPTISTPLEANLKVNRGGENLFAIDNEAWLNSFLKIYYNDSFYKEVGRNNYHTFKSYYTIEQNYKYYYRVFLDVMKY